MNHVDTISDEFLNALVDGQLEVSEQDAALQAINEDAALRDRVCELRSLKQLVQHAYPKPALDSTYRHGFRSVGWLRPLAACFVLLMAGGVAGWFVHDWRAAPPGNGQMSEIPQAIRQNEIETRQVNYVVQVDTANPIRLKTALDEAESLLANRDAQSAQVEIVANGPGLNLLREGVSPYARRLMELQTKYPNLTLMACGKTIRKLQEEGVAVELLPHTKITPSALEQIITRRLKQHWVYIKV
jgi:intracellular sulfur oxidation DsrE/DsrF family protein